MARLVFAFSYGPARMKEPARTIHKDLRFKRGVRMSKIDISSFITVHNPLKQFPLKI